VAPGAPGFRVYRWAIFRPGAELTVADTVFSVNIWRFGCGDGGDILYVIYASATLYALVAAGFCPSHIQVFVQVDEKGTEAAAVTALVLNESLEILTASPEVMFDRPFLFLVVDDASGNLLFLGAVKDPSKAPV
jgi:hypothetical protein